MGPPLRIDPTTYHTMSNCSTKELHSSMNEFGLVFIVSLMGEKMVILCSVVRMRFRKTQEPITVEAGLMGILLFPANC